MSMQIKTISNSKPINYQPWHLTNIYRLNLNSLEKGIVDYIYPYVFLLDLLVSGLVELMVHRRLALTLQ